METTKATDLHIEAAAHHDQIVKFLATDPVSLTIGRVSKQMKAVQLQQTHHRRTAPWSAVATAPCSLLTATCQVACLCATPAVIAEWCAISSSSDMLVLERNLPVAVAGGTSVSVAV